MQQNINFPVDPALQTWQDLPQTQTPVPYPTPPLLTFTSSQVPPFTTEEVGQWQFRDEDIVLFDSLLNTDLEGNWNF